MDNSFPGLHTGCGEDGNGYQGIVRIVIEVGIVDALLGPDFQSTCRGCTGCGGKHDFDLNVQEKGRRVIDGGRDGAAAVSQGADTRNGKRRDISIDLIDNSQDPALRVRLRC